MTIHGKKYELYYEHEYEEMWRSAERSTSHKDETFYIDKDGVPHWDGTDPAKYLKQYKARVLIEYETTIGDSEVAVERRQNLALRLTRGLTGKAWDIVEPVLVKKDKGHLLVLAALDTLDKEAVLKKQEKFDDFFKRSWRRTGQDMADYIREKETKYLELKRLDKDTKLSDDLYAYFLLEGARLKDDQKKLVTMVADNEFETKSFIKTLRTNYHDVHVTEKRATGYGTPHDSKGEGRKGGGKGKSKGKRFDKKPEKSNYTEYEDEEYGDEDEANAVDEGDGEADDDDEAYEISDAGASEDEEIADAYAAYDQARAQLRDQQKRRGFFKATGTLRSARRRSRSRSRRRAAPPAVRRATGQATTRAPRKVSSRRPS